MFGVTLALLAALLVVRTPRVSREPGLSVLLVTIDTLRADALGSYGNARAATPWLDRLAHEGVRFERAYAHNVVTLPSHANILAGRYPTEHGVRDNAGFRFPRELPSMAGLLKQAGYRTAAFVSAFPLDSRFGLEAGFDVYDDAFLNVDAERGHVVQQRAGSQTVALALRWLEGAKDARSFCWVHLYEPHFPYAPPEPVASRFREHPYDGEVAAADEALAPLLRPLLERGRAGRTLVVLTSDHGEGLGEHGEATHGTFAYQGTLRVPLLLFAPGLLTPRVVGGTARHVDLLPTVLDALSLPAPAGLPGQSLWAAAQGASLAERASYFEALTAALSRGWAPLYGIVERERKYIELPLPELYDLERDAGERQNLLATHPREAEALRGLLAAERNRDKGVRRASEGSEVRERLRALGYVAGVAAPAFGREAADDPKNLVGLDALLQEAVTFEVQGRLDEALARYRELIQRRPTMALSYLHLARLLRLRGDQAGAVAALRQALQHQPGDVVTAALLGAYLNEAGRPGEAVKLLEPYAAASDPDVDVLAALGMALAAAGRREDAKRVFETARRVDPSDAIQTVNLATVYMLGREDERASELLREAIAQRPDLFRAWNALGVIAARAGRSAEAIEHWRRALQADADALDTLFNLGATLVQLGRRAEARPIPGALRGARAAPGLRRGPGARERLAVVDALIV
jgi:Flp pilus assembly protein TadD